MLYLRDSSIDECLDAWAEHESKTRHQGKSIEQVKKCRGVMMDPLKEMDPKVSLQLLEMNDHTLMRTIYHSSWMPSVEAPDFRGRFDEVLYFSRLKQMGETLDFEDREDLLFHLLGMTLFTGSSDNFSTILEGNNRLLRLYVDFGVDLYRFVPEIFVIETDAEYRYAWPFLIRSIGILHLSKNWLSGKSLFQNMVGGPF